MVLKQLAEICWQLYDNGRPSATNQTLEQDDLQQMVFLESAYQLKIRFYQSRKDNDGEKTDFIAGLLGTQQYDLSDANYLGKRSATYKDEVMRLPKNMDVTNVFMVNSSCEADVAGRLSQVQPGEERFYATDPDLTAFQFFVQKGQSIDTYHVPPAIKKIEVERIFTTENLDIPLDIAYEVATNVLGVTLKVRGIIPTEDNPVDGNRNPLRQQLEYADKKM